MDPRLYSQSLTLRFLARLLVQYLILQGLKKLITELWN